MDPEQLFRDIGSSNSTGIVSCITWLNSTSRDRITLDFDKHSLTTSYKSSGTSLNIPRDFDRMILKVIPSSELNLKCVMTSSQSIKTFLITSTETKLPLQDETGRIHIQILEESKQMFSMHFIKGENEQQDLHSSLTSNRHLSETVPNPFPIPMADGPLFREAINTYEQLAPIILKKLHSSIEKASNEPHSKGIEYSKTQMMDALKDFKKGFSISNTKSDSLYSKYKDPNNSTKTDLIYMFFNALKNTNCILRISPTSIKGLRGFSSRKKTFEEESKKFYDWLSKLMGSGKSKDEKLLTKIKSFQSAQMIYFNYLFDTMTPILLSLVDAEPTAIKMYWENKPLRSNAVDLISNCTTLEVFTETMKTYSRTNPSHIGLLFMDPSSPYKFCSPKYTTLKTGLLFVHGGQGKSGWHKQWLVLYNGKLYEYMDWRRGATLRNQPIDISLCNIKLLESNEHKNTIDIGARKNCFRVINPQGVEHVFQSFTSNEAEEWVKSLTEAGQVVTFSKKPGMNFPITGITSNSNDSLNRLPTRTRRVSSVSLSLLNVVQRNSTSNNVCAECGSSDKVDWISLNILVIFCIQCSSAHRNLGTSISKVRSLTLDSFAGESRCLIYHIDNHQSNSIYEATLPPDLKPNPESSYESRLKFVKDKYLLKMFVSDDIKNKSNEILIDGVKTDNIQKVLTGLAGNARVNQNILLPQPVISESVIAGYEKPPSNHQITLLEYALLNPSILDGMTVFDVAELLTLNGCDAGTQVREGSLINNKARTWWQERINKLNCKDNVNINILVQSRRSEKKIGTARLDTSRKEINSTDQSNKIKSRSPKDSFNLFKKKLMNHD